MKESARTIFERLGKRAIDLAGASALAICLLPVMVLVALAVRLSLGRPVLFRQRRVGIGGRIFTIWKFRTMLDAADSAGRPLPDAERLTSFGRLLRNTSLDELPQLLNVLRGEMSLVGPRPLLPQYLDRYTPEQARRHEVLPGITGWCQVRGRNALSWEDKFCLDVWYVDHWSLGLDLYILAQTLVALVRRDGVSHGQEATMPEFLGQPKKGSGLICAAHPPGRSRQMGPDPLFEEKAA
ncbi:MAG: sugar transferase [Planctomycetaceae bacterium]|nr:sugar transferase [Planctomycetaceae bacterium]